MEKMSLSTSVSSHDPYDEVSTDPVVLNLFSTDRRFAQKAKDICLGQIIDRFQQEARENMKAFTESVKEIAKRDVIMIHNPKYKMELCLGLAKPNYHEGIDGCPLFGSSCPFAHTLAELVANKVLRNPLYKTAECRSKLASDCTYGSICNFRHTGEMLNVGTPFEKKNLAKHLMGQSRLAHLLNEIIFIRDPNYELEEKKEEKKVDGASHNHDGDGPEAFEEGVYHDEGYWGSSGLYYGPSSDSAASASVSGASGVEKKVDGASHNHDGDGPEAPEEDVYDDEGYWDPSGLYYGPSSGSAASTSVSGASGVEKNEGYWDPSGLYYGP